MKIAVVVALALVLLLAVNYAVFRNHLNRIKELPIQLPANESSPEQVSASEVQIVILSSSAFTLDGETIDMAKLKNRLAVAKSTGKMSIKVNSSPENYETVPAILDLIRESGFERVSVETRVGVKPGAP